MRVKRYVSSTIHEAMEKIRLDLGKDAVILNTKRIKTGGFLGLFKREEVEVLAAIDDERMRDAHSISEQVFFKDFKANKIEHAQADDFTSRIMPTETQTGVDDGQVLKEVKQMRELVTYLVKQQKEEQLYLPEFSEVVARLREQEVEEKIITYLIDQALKNRESASITEKEAQSLIRAQIIELLQRRFMAPINPTVRLFHIVGPTGVGKTTTIAKLAANFMLKQHKRVGLITTDTYRIAAIDQLRTYANILNAPLEVVYKAEELQQAVSQLANNDILIMDTAGRNYRNKTYIDELSSLLASTLPSETYIVLGLTAKYNDNLAILNQFEHVKIDKVIYTKMDETESYGSILNIAYHYPIQLSFITNGQTVPDDFFIANPEQLTDIILGGGSQ